MEGVLYVPVYNVLLYLYRRCSPLSSSMAPPRLCEISVVLWEFSIAEFPKNPLFDFLLLPWEQDHDVVPKALIVLYSQFLTPAQVVIVPFFFFPESTSGTVY